MRLGRFGVIAGIAALIAAGVAYGASLYAQQRAAALVEAYFSEAALFEEASHGKLRYVLFRDRLELDDVALRTREPQPHRLSGDHVVLTGIGLAALFGGREVRLGSVVVDQLAIESAAGVQYRAHRLEAVEPRADPAALALTGADLRSSLEGLAQISAASITIEGGHVVRTDPALEGSVARLVLAGLGEGRIATLAAEGLVQDLGPEEERNHLELDRLEAERIDLAALARLLDFRAESAADAALYAPVESLGGSGLRFRHGALGLSLDRFSLAGPKLARSGAESLSLDRLEASQLDFSGLAPGGGSLAIGHVALAGMAPGRIDHVAVEVLAMKAENGSAFRVGSYALEGYAYRLLAPQADLPPVLAALRRPARLFFERLDLADLVFEPASGAEVSLAQLHAAMAGNLDLPLSGSAEAKQLSLDLAALPLPPGAFEPAALGYGRVAFDLLIDTRYDPEAKTVEMPHFRLSAAEVGTLELSLSLGNVVLDPKSADGLGDLQHWLAAVLRRLELRYEDDSLTSRLLSAAADRQKSDVESLRAGLLLRLEAYKHAHGERPGMAAIIDAVAAFLREPRALTFTMAPPEPLTLQQAAVLWASGAPDLVATLGLSAH